ncbi:MAG: hypothetical protein HY825_04450 [Acidobacteria bacterium]|nr:hypothetical protein [Acidobacteriota bacterium]
MVKKARVGVVALMGTVLATSAIAQAQRPDLRVNAIYLAKWTPPPVTEYEKLGSSVFSGSKVILVCEVINGGVGKVVGNYFVSFRIDGAEVGSQLIENAPDPGMLRKPGVAWTPSALGSHVFKCSVDPYPSRQVESNEENNEKPLRLQVKARKLPMTLPH